MGIFNKFIPFNNNAFLKFFGFLSIILLSTNALSQIIDKTAPSQPLKKLHITSDKLVARQNSRHIIFSGHVVALYELTTIKSDKLQVYYNGQDVQKELNNKSVKKIIASGKVRIELEDKIAECDKAVYKTSTNTLILTGENARLQSKNNYITGDQIIIYQNTGQIIVNGSQDKRVNAVFQPEKKISTPDQK